MVYIYIYIYIYIHMFIYIHTYVYTYVADLTPVVMPSTITQPHKTANLATLVYWYADAILDMSPTFRRRRPLPLLHEVLALLPTSCSYRYRFALRLISISNVLSQAWSTCSSRIWTRTSAEPKRGFSKPTVYISQTSPSILINKLQTTVPQHNTHAYMRGMYENDQPQDY